MLRKMSSNEVQFSKSNNTSIYNISTTSSNKNSLINSNKESRNIFQTKNSHKLGNEFLKCRKWKYIDEENWIEIEDKLELIGAKLKQENLNKIINEIKLAKLNRITKDIRNTNLNAIFIESRLPLEYPYAIGPLNSLNYLIENTYYFNQTEEEIMLNDRKILEPYINKFRIIKGDGNCFIRGIIFYSEKS